MLKIRLSDLTPEGLQVTQVKTGKKLLYEWTLELRAAVDQALRLPRTVPKRGHIQMQLLDMHQDVIIDELVNAPITYVDGRNDNWHSAPVETRHL